MRTDICERGLSASERQIVNLYSRGSAVTEIALVTKLVPETIYQALGRPHVAVAVRAEIMRLFATEGAQIAYRTLKKIALDDAAPAAARVAAAAKLGAGAKILDNPAAVDPLKEQPLNVLTREQLDQVIREAENELASRATPINAPVNAPVRAGDSAGGLDLIDE